jgi:hypothetical protein
MVVVSELTVKGSGKEIGLSVMEASELPPYSGVRLSIVSAGSRNGNVIFTDSVSAMLLSYVGFISDWISCKLGPSTSVYTGCGCDVVDKFLKRRPEHLSSTASADRPMGFIKTGDFLTNTGYHLREAVN